MTGSGVAAEGIMGLEPHQERVIVEKMDLAERLEKLQAFFAGNIFLTIPTEEQARLTRQLAIMRDYVAVLDERIAAF